MTTQSKDRIIGLVGNIGSKSKNAGLLKACKLSETASLSSYIECTAIQSLLFALVMYLSANEEHPGISDIAKHLDADPLELLNYYSNLRNLQKKGLIRKERAFRNDSITELKYYIPTDIMESLVREETGFVNKSRIKDSVSLFSRIAILMKFTEDEIINKNELIEEVNEIVEDNRDIPVVKRIRSLRLSRNNLLLLLTLGSKYLSGEDETDLNDHLEEIIEDASERFRLKRDIVSGNNDLITKELVHLEKSMFRNDKNIGLTDKVVKIMFDLEFNEKKLNNAIEGLVLPESILPRKLYFNPEEDRQLTTIRRMLMQKSYSKISSELKKNNLPAGIAILLHGEPGTGKTEAVNQLARKLKKPLMRVDISSTKSMWFGESEKEIKKVFDKYISAVGKNKNCPILFFNEADGILGRRKKTGTSAVDQTENAIQNIILQEMEELKGIMIATTNLAGNLDRAFERRFLYKVKFEKPSVEIRARIWKEHIRDLTLSEAKYLASAFNYTGGHIANVARKVISDGILNGRPTTMDEIMAYCREEMIEVENGLKVGFRIN